MATPSPPLIAEEKLLFGLIATHPLIKTVQELEMYTSRLDITAIRREVREHAWQLQQWYCT